MLIPRYFFAHDFSQFAEYFASQPHKKRTFHKNELLWEVGQPHDTIHYILSGVEMNYADHESGRRKIISFHGAGRVIGPEPCTADARFICASSATHHFYQPRSHSGSRLASIAFSLFFRSIASFVFYRLLQMMHSHTIRTEISVTKFSIESSTKLSTT